MVLTINLDDKAAQELRYAVMELDILTCQEGQCLEEPAHWTEEEVIYIILSLYLKDIRTLLTIKPVPSKLWPHILPKTGRTEPPPTLESVMENYSYKKKKRA